MQSVDKVMAISIRGPLKRSSVFFITSRFIGGVAP